MKVGFFEEKENIKSITRVMTFSSLVAGLVIAISSVFMKSVTFGDAMPMVVTLLMYSVGAKLGQKAMEK